MSEDPNEASKETSIVPADPKKSRTAHLPKFQPGQSGNPTGRPKGQFGLARRIREATKEGADIVTLLTETLAGTAPKATHRDRLDAARMLLDRGWGRAVETHLHLDGNGSADLKNLADDALEAWVRSLPQSVGSAVVDAPPARILSESLTDPSESD